MKYRLLTLISFIVLSSSCQTTKGDSNIKGISSEELKTLLKNDSVQFVDVRTIKEFNEQYIKGAQNIVYDKTFDQKLNQLDKDEPVIVYCRSGRRSSASAKILEVNGFTEIYNLEGGILKWTEEGNKVE
jgi:rhodanese-related sulfurtransferase